MSSAPISSSGHGTPPVVELREIKKRFGAIVALQGVDLTVGRGEVLGLVGDNGAGKSTLMKILSGALAPDEGEILVDGDPVSFSGPREARSRGIEMVYQDLALCDDLDVASNFFLGREPKQFGLLRRRRLHAETRRELGELGIRVKSTSVPIRSLSGGQRQAVAIGRAVSFTPRLLIMDEPTAALGVREVELVLDLIRRVSAQGVGVILISHRLQDIIDVCHRVTVLYEGRNTADLVVADTSLESLVRHIVSDPSQAAA
jgi:simple sugar transport system ATP-binding protein